MGYKHEFSSRGSWSCNVKLTEFDLNSKGSSIASSGCEIACLSDEEFTRLGCIDFSVVQELTEDQASLLRRIQMDVVEHLGGYERRLVHVLSVVKSALNLARIYNVEVYPVLAAALLHDWDKNLTVEELHLQVDLFKVDLPCTFERAMPVIHGLLSAKKLPSLYPELPTEVFDAVAEHTIGSVSATDISQVVFLADMIEEKRRAAPELEMLRSQVGDLSLRDLYVAGLATSIKYVLSTRRYVIPKSIDVYNALVIGE